MALAMSLIMAVCLSSCGKSDVNGGDMIEAARKSYEKLDSCEVLVTNTQTSKVEQTFTFMIDSKDIMHYSSTVISGNDTTKEYYDGKTLVTNKNGESTKREKGSKGFPNYTKKVRYMKAAKQMIIYEPKAVKMSTVNKDEKGLYTVVHNYNPKSIKFDNVDGTVEEFTVTYNFDKDKNLVDFVEKTVIDRDGTKTTSEYKIEFTKKNQIKSIINPE